jgi:uncharacterized protein YgbK (DUF1537 family)
MTLLLSYYGDDFTGSTDSLEALTLAGVRGALFFEPPDQALLAGRFRDLEAVGVAGVSRSWSPEEMEAGLRPAFQRLRELGAPITHYKICSTFDSSPQVGSVGRAIDIGQSVFGGAWVPLLVGAPALRRYTMFGNLFATVAGATYRLDRHPTMSRHPVTPMDEADLRLHLARQTNRPIALVDLLALAEPPEALDGRVDALIEQGAPVVLFDVLDQARLEAAGRQIWRGRGDAPLFVAGSSGVEYALTAHWRASGQLARERPSLRAGPVDRLLVVSGSASPDTDRQIAWAVGQGFGEIALDTVRLADPALAAGERARAVEQAAGLLAAGQNVVMHTSRGPHDPRLSATAAALRELGRGPRVLGEELGQMLRALVERSRLRRVIVAGGDSSGHAVRGLGILALEVVAPTAPGSPLCRAASAQPAFDGLEIALKGGQVGRDDYFESVMRGSV